MQGSLNFDVIVVGGGPAGSAMGWALARKGVKVAVLERTTFPREKVCGDFVEPAGLRLLAAMGATEVLRLPERLPITHNRVYYGPHAVYQGDIPYYEGKHGMPPHGYIVPRDELDTVLLANAQRKGATVMMATQATDVRRDNGVMHVDIRHTGGAATLTAPLVVGADGVQSVVARSAGLRRTDRRHIGVSQRAYVEGVEIDSPDGGGESMVWFDEDQYPGYGWMFPMHAGNGGGRANFGVGMLSESCERFGLSLQETFRQSIDRLRLRHPGCAKARLASKPLGGAVHMYGGILRNHFDGGILVGDAGGFVDPMTAEGITQGMESSIIGSRTLLAALEAGRFDVEAMAPFETDFRAYFDPAMLYLCFCATVMRNRHFAEYAIRGTRRGFEKAQSDREFGRVSGAAFGGVDVHPPTLISQMWASMAAHMLDGGKAALRDLIAGRGFARSGVAGDLAAWQRGWKASMADDPSWHFSWLADITRATARLRPSLTVTENPRLRGPLAAEMATA